MVRSDQNKQYTSELVTLAKYNLIACGFETLTVDNTSGGLSLIRVPTNARYALIVVESDATGTAIRYKQLGDVNAPTDSEGIPRSNLDVFDLQGYQNIINFRTIEAQTGTHTLQVEYYK